MSGLTSAGFIAATTSDVQTGIQNDELALIDPALDLSPVQPLGQINGIFASAQANLWALVAAIYAAMDPAGAIGVQLDNLCAITGVTRLAATKTLVTCTVNLNTGTYAPNTLTANIAGQSQNTFRNRDTIVAPGGSLTGVVFLATSTGPITCNSNTLTVISPPVTGFNSITNPAAGNTGTNVETDTALRLRRAQNIVPSGGCTIDSLLSALLNPTIVPGIVQATVLENNTNAVDVNGQPPHSFQACIWDGPSLAASNASIAQAIWNAKPAGIQAFGQTAFTGVVDASGHLQTVSFTRVTQLPIFFTVNIRVNPVTFPGGVGSPVGGLLVVAAIVALQTTPNATGYVLGPGVKVIYDQFRAAAMSVLGVVEIISMTVDPFATPVDSVDIVITPNQIATIAPGNVNVFSFL